jgi:hypothetical protein
MPLMLRYRQSQKSFELWQSGRNRLFGMSWDWKSPRDEYSDVMDYGRATGVAAGPEYLHRM